MLAIRDTMRWCVRGLALAGAGVQRGGQFLLSAGARRRYALPHARILMHQGSSGIAATAVDVEVQADDLATW